MGCGLDICYPASNKKLMESIRKEGLLLSEYDNEALPKPYNFPRRNRIISGLCASTVVVEAARESGSLITAELAASQGRSVYAVPGDITSRHSFGANMLIHDGAIPLIIIDDIIRDMGISPRRSGRASGSARSTGIALSSPGRWRTCRPTSPRP